MIAGILEKPKLTEDMILIQALLYAKANHGKLPKKYSVHVDGFSGQTWQSLDSALRYQFYGLDRQGLKGISHLFNIYGLKIGYKENPKVVAGAIKTLDETGHHGLHLVVDRPLSQLAARRRGKYAQPAAA